MSDLTEAELALARRHGVTLGYTDWRGEPRTVPADTVRAVLAVIGPTLDAAPPVPEAAVRRHPTTLRWPDRLSSQRTWGLAIQLYSVRSSDSWGVGDLADLRRLAVWSARELGADFVLANPLAAAQPGRPMEPSPYLPTSRFFGNPLYLRVEDVPEYAGLPPAERARVERMRTAVHDELDDLDAIDRDRSWAAKQAALRAVHRVPRTTAREAAYLRFKADDHDLLQDFATWCALAEVHGGDWTAWPAELRHPASDSVRAFRDANPDAVDFHCWLQWLLDEQLARAQDAAVAAGMRIGLMHDLAVGVHPRGADAWALQDLLAADLSVGAPPDDYNQLGQDWSQPPWRPDRLAAADYRPYRQLVGRLLRHGGALRLDHVIGLFRLWCLPRGAAAADGTYIRFDHARLLDILVEEARRTGAVIIGEDLGVVEPTARATLAGRGILGTSILWFERLPDGSPRPADEWRELCLGAVTTHDLPPTAGYLAGEHVELRHRLGLLARPLEVERADALAERSRWLDVLRREHLLSPGSTPEHEPEEVVIALHRYLTRTPARLLAVALTDAVGDRRAQNQPGTTDEYPNWRVPLTDAGGRLISLEDVEAAPSVRRLAAAVTSGIEAAATGSGAL